MGRRLAILLTLGLIAVGCGDAADTDTEAVDVAVPGVEEALPTLDTEPPTAIEPVSADELAALVASNNDFALELFRDLLAEAAEPNVVISPWNISEGLALPYLGARGDTASEMAAALRFDLPGETQHAAAATLRELLRRHNSDHVSITAANRLFGQTGLPFHDEFLADQSRFYEAPMQTVDFGVDGGEAARLLINEWTAANTGDEITDLFPPGAIDANTRLALVSALHFEADWKYPFDAGWTRLAPFTTADGSTVNVEMMSYHQALPLMTYEDATIVRLPYAGGDLSFIAVLAPTSNDAWLGSIDSTDLAAIRDGLEEEDGLHLYIPKFDVSSHRSLVGPLHDLGMQRAFGAADFSGIADAGLFISAIEHEAFVRIDEKGTEAGAATGTAMALSHGPDVVFDRPFLFWIQDDHTGQLLFIGRVGDPDPTG